MEIIIQIIYIIQIIVFVYLAMATSYIFFFAIAGLFKLKTIAAVDSKKRKFAVLIPGYKEDAVIIDVAKDALLQEYPKELYDVIIIADSFKPKTLKKLKELPVKVIEVSFEQSTKSKALNKAMEQLPDIYDGVIILDADNLMEKEFISKVNKTMSAGFVAVQGHRIAKNTDTSFAILDAVSEEINNHIFRKGHRVIGLPSALIGSGMGFDYQLFKKYMATIDSFAEDKELELILFINRHKVEYIEKGIVYDEKVSKSKVFLKQRSRWIAFQMDYAKKHFFQAFYQLFVKGNIDFFNKILQQFLPPRILNLGLLFIITVVSLIFNSGFFYYAWLITFFICVIALAVSVPNRFYNYKTLKAILCLPFGFFLMIRSLTRYKKAKKGFMPTPHTGKI